MTDVVSTSPVARIGRVAFFGTPAAAVPTLNALVVAGFEVPIVITQPDRRRGRGSRLIPSPVKTAAVDQGLAIAHDPYDALDATPPVDLGVVVAYGRLLRPDLLDELAMINVHFSLLPRWRGAAPVERAILAGDTTTGVCVMAVTEGLDEGPLYGCAETDIDTDETAIELTSRLANLGANLLIEVLSAPLTEPKPQQGPVLHAAKIDRAENELDFSLPAVELHRRVRIGRAWTEFRSERLGIERSAVVPAAMGCAESGTDEPGQMRLSAGGDQRKSVLVTTGDGSRLQLLTVKPPGKRAVAAHDWWNGVQPDDGERLGH